MASPSPAQTSSVVLPPQRDWMRLIARCLCAVFALLGVLPVGLGVAVRSEPARVWVEGQARLLLQRELELAATFQLRVKLWPLRVDLERVVVPANDGGGPAIEVDRIAIAPRVFSLLGGRVDAGDVAIEGARQRLVIEGGVVRNVHYRLPARTDQATTRAPFTSLSLTDGAFDLQLDGVALQIGAVDLDVFPDGVGHYEVALRVSDARVRMPEGTYPEPKAGQPGQWDGDVLCELDTRLRLEAGSILVRRVSLLGAVDIDPRPDTAPDCRRHDDDPPGRVALRANQLRLTPKTETAPWLVQGEFMLRAPFELLNRVAPDAGPLTGWIGLNGSVRYDGSSTLPNYQGKLKLSELALADQIVMQGAEGTLELRQDTITVPALTVQYGTGSVAISDVTIAPFEPGAPLHVKSAVVSRVPFPQLMQNLAITNDTIVQFMIEVATVKDFGGTLSPPKLDGQMSAEVTDFEITRGSYRSPTRKRMFGLNSKGFTRGTFSVREDTIQFNNQVVQFGNSRLHTNVHVGIEDGILVETWDSAIDLADVSPIVTVPLKGVLRLDTKMDGNRGNPLLRSDISITGLDFAGFPIGDVERAKLTFRPLWIELEDTILRKGESRMQLTKTRVDFDAGPDIQFDTRLAASGLNVRDFMAMWLFDQNPRWQDVSGHTDVAARIHYVLGGPDDRCGDGALRLHAALDMDKISLFGETYDGGHAELKLDWLDTEASYHGLDLDLPTVQLRKGTGTLLGNLHVSPGASLRGSFVATAVPLNELDAMSGLRTVTGSMSGVATLSGSLDALAAQAQVDVGHVTIGRSRFAPSNVHVTLEPRGPELRYEPDVKTGCGRRIPAPAPSTDVDPVAGLFRVSGHLFGGQIGLDDFSVTRQTHKVVRGGVVLTALDLRPIIELNPAVALMSDRPTGTLSGRVDLEQWPLGDLARARARARIDDLQVSWQGFTTRVGAGPVLELAGDGVQVNTLTLQVAKRGARPLTLDVQGGVQGLATQPVLDLSLGLRPLALADLAELVPSARRMEGTVAGRVRLTGTPKQPVYSGGFELRGGLLEFRGSPLSLANLDVDIALDNETLDIRRATGSLGSGKVSATGLVPLDGLRPKGFRGRLAAEGVALPVARGVDITVDSELEAAWEPAPADATAPNLPKVTGEVTITAFEYSRPVTMNADISTLTGRPKRTQFESYDPQKDVVELDILVTSKGALALNNNLIEAKLELEPPGLRLLGTNQRYGLKGSMRVLPGGRIRLRRNDFEVQTGEITFEDATRVAARVDVTAVTEYRRFSSTTSTGTSAPTTAAASTGASASGTTAGQWRINMRAHGDADNLKLDLTSQPALSQDDIFLLLTVGLTRAELDQAQSASLGESVALEALGSLTGADSAVSEAIPAIDEFRFGSSYSARTGRTEPTVTVGKRLSERIRAYVTSGISESREVRSNVEWRLNRGVTVEGSYDNVNDVSSSSLGNLGADVRWRLEFR